MMDCRFIALVDRVSYEYTVAAEMEDGSVMVLGSERRIPDDELRSNRLLRYDIRRIPTKGEIVNRNFRSQSQLDGPSLTKLLFVPLKALPTYPMP